MLCMCMGYTMSNPSAAGRREREFLDSRRAVLPSIFSLSFSYFECKHFREEKKNLHLHHLLSFFLSLSITSLTHSNGDQQKERKTPIGSTSISGILFFSSPFVPTFFLLLLFYSFLKKFRPHTWAWAETYNVLFGSLFSFQGKKKKKKKINKIPKKYQSYYYVWWVRAGCARLAVSPNIFTTQVFAFVWWFFIFR